MKDRKITVEFAPEREDPYHRDYKIEMHNEALIEVIRLTAGELQQIHTYYYYLHGE